MDKILIIIIDDDKDTLLLLSDIIKAEGYEAITAGDGRKPTDKAGLKKVNTILIRFSNFSPVSIKDIWVFYF